MPTPPYETQNNLYSFCFFALAFPQCTHAIPLFGSAKRADFSEVDNSEIGTRMPLILVHGIQSDPGMWNEFLQYFNSTPALKDNFKPYTFQFFTKNFLMSSTDPDTVGGLGQSLGNYIKQWSTAPTRSPIFGFNGKPVVVLAHSFGGLVTRSMMAQQIPGVQVSLLITLATPHHGSPVANEYYASPTATKWIGNRIFNQDLNTSIAHDLAWDCYNGVGYWNFCGQGVQSSASDISKIIAYGGTTDPVSASALELKAICAQLIVAGYPNDGVVPIASALFEGSSARIRRVKSPCDHYQIYSATKLLETGVSVFDSITADLQTAIPPIPARPLLWEVSPNVLTGVAVPEKRRIRLIGSGFSASCTLTFNDGVNSPYTGRVPNFVSGSELNYDLAVGINAANWTVKVVKGAQESDLRTFTVVPPLPPATGALTISLSPPEAISAGAQWQVDGSAFHYNGDVVTGLTPGAHAIVFHSASGFVTPATRNMNIVGGALTSDTQNYEETPPTGFNLTLGTDGYGYISPSFIGTGTGSTYPNGASIRLTAVGSSGYHFVSWGGDLSGSGNPADVVMTGNKSITATFAPGDPRLGTLTVTIQPPEAVAAGVTWGWNENDFRASGSSYATDPGGYFIVIHYVAGWTGFGLVPVRLTGGETTNYTVAVSSTSGGTAGTDPTTYFTLAGTAGENGSVDAEGLAARFFDPWGVAVDSQGNVYIGDKGNRTIRKISLNGAVTTIAGTAGVQGSQDGNGASASFDYPSAISVDGAGNVYVADPNVHTIRKISPTYQVTTFAGAAGSSGSSDGVGNDARFKTPGGIATDATGNVYVADSFNHTIRKITPSRVVSTLAGHAGTFGTSDGTGDTARFKYPTGIAVDASGNVWVTDNFTIRKISPGGTVTTLAGFPGSAGDSNGSGDSARFGNANGLAIDPSGNAIVADSNNSTIRKVTPDGVVTTLAGLSGATGSADGTGAIARFKYPNTVAVDSTGNIFVSDAGNSTIRTTRPPPPRFSMALSNDKANFTWPTSATGFILESTSNLTTPAWATVFPPPTIVGSDNKVTIVISDPARFYRLRH
jgi:sugar lactone lactonase YvrE